jgi:hypothetical protein
VVNIHPHARTHGLADEDIRHAFRTVLATLPHPDPDRLLIAAVTRSGQFVQLVVVDFDTDSPTIIHCMRLQAKFFRYLPGGDPR